MIAFRVPTVEEQAEIAFFGPMHYWPQTYAARRVGDVMERIPRAPCHPQCPACREYQDSGDEDDPTADRLFNRSALLHRWRYTLGKTVIYWPARRVFHDDHDPGDEEPTMVKDFGVYNYCDLI